MRQLPACLVLAAAASIPRAAAAEIGSIGDATFEFGGLVQYDAYRYRNDLADLDGSLTGDDREHDFRRIELVLKGALPGGLDWVVAYDAKSEVFLDANLRLRFGADRQHALQLGQFKQPNSLDELTSARSNDFIAKATASNTYGISRRLGLGYVQSRDDWSLAASAFGRKLGSGQDRGSGFGLRGTWVPIRTDGSLLHLGLSHVDHDTDADTLRLRARPNADLASVRLVDSGQLVDTDRIATTGVEALWLAGPLKLQGELFHAQVRRHANSDYDSGGAYASALWNLGGTAWTYRNGLPALPSADTRLWQLGLRYDLIDLDDEDVQGGRQEAVTAGVNWYAGKHLKLMLNHVRVSSRRHGIDDDPSIWEARAQLSW